MILAELKSLIHAFREKDDVTVLDSLSLHLLVALSETLDAANCIINQIVNEIIISNLLLIDYLSSVPHDDL